nr:hypothetical protein [Burkholderia gladioli]
MRTHPQRGGGDGELDGAASAGDRERLPGTQPGRGFDAAVGEGEPARGAWRRSRPQAAAARAGGGASPASMASRPRARPARTASASLGHSGSCCPGRTLPCPASSRAMLTRGSHAPRGPRTTVTAITWFR